MPWHKLNTVLAYWQRAHFTGLRQLFAYKFSSCAGKVGRTASKSFTGVRHCISAMAGHRVWVSPVTRSDWKERIGPDFVTNIDNRDEMYRFLLAHSRDRQETQAAYFVSGKQATDAFADIIEDHGERCESLTSLLEFACGYGRVTRFLVTRVPQTRVTVSDVDRHALRFNAKTFNTTPVLSSDSPDSCSCDRTFHIIFVASLFSHLNIDLWRRWLITLYALLDPGGLLIFSTHGETHDLPEPTAPLMVEDGFWFHPSNETDGRLDTHVYGTTWVTESWVRRFCEASELGSLERYYPCRLWRQDVYVLRHSA